MQLVASSRVPGKVSWFETVKMAERNQHGDQHIIQVTGRVQTKGIQSKAETTMRVAIRHRSRKTD
jgi:hypothetical protein